MKRTGIIVLVTISTLLVVVIFLGIPTYRTVASSLKFYEFCSYIRNSDWASASQMVATDPSVFRIEAGKVLYYDMDRTSMFMTAKPDLLYTLDYYLTDERSAGEDRVVFRGSSKQDYVRMKNGKVIWIKMP